MLRGNERVLTRSETLIRHHPIDIGANFVRIYLEDSLLIRARAGACESNLLYGCFSVVLLGFKPQQGNSEGLLIISAAPRFPVGGKYM